MAKYPLLLKRGRIRGLSVKNRLFVPAMGTGLATPSGMVTPSMIEHYRERSRGPGVVVVENVGVERRGRSGPNSLFMEIGREDPLFPALLEGIEKGGAIPFVQINHAGRQVIPDLADGEPVAPSAIPCPLMRVVPKELSPAEIDGLIRRFAETALQLKGYGAKGVEVHMAHGYLICQFLSPLSNRREDRYGGDIEARSLFAREVIEGIKGACGSDFPVACKISSREFTGGGITITDSIRLSELLEGSGADAIVVSGGSGHSLPYMVPSYLVEDGVFADSAKEIRAGVRIPVMLVGRVVSPGMAEELLREGYADFAGFGRPSLADPEFSMKVVEGEDERIRPCLYCNHCIESIAGGRVECAVNFWTGRVKADYEPAFRGKRVVIAGGGPAGLNSFLAAVDTGNSPILFEREELGGLLRFSYILKEKEGHRRYLRWLIREVEARGEGSILMREAGREDFEGADLVVIATGKGVRSAAGNETGPGLLDSADFLKRGVHEAGKVAVVGGGPRGCEIALFLLRQAGKPAPHRDGVEVTLIEIRRRVGLGLPVSVRMLLEEILIREGVDLLTGVKFISFDKGRVRVERRGRIFEIPADLVIISGEGGESRIDPPSGKALYTGSVKVDDGLFSILNDVFSIFYRRKGPS